MRRKVSDAWRPKLTQADPGSGTKKGEPIRARLLSFDRLDVDYAAFATLPERIHLVQTTMPCTPPAIMARTRCRLGLQVRLVLLLA